MFKLAIIYDESGKRYTLPFTIAIKTLKISKEDITKLETEVKKHIAGL